MNALVARLTEHPDRRVWDLAGFSLNQLCLDYRVTLLFSQAGSALWVTLENTFTVHVGGQTDEVDPENAMSHAPVLALLHQEAASLKAFREGTLRIQFASGAEIEVAKHEQYESWQTDGEGELAGAGMLCTPYPGPPWYE